MGAIPYAALRALRAGTIASAKDRRALLTMGTTHYGLIAAASAGGGSLYSDDFSTNTISRYNETTGFAEISGGTLHVVPEATQAPTLALPSAANLSVGKVAMDFAGAVDGSVLEIVGTDGVATVQLTAVPAGYAAASFAPLALLNATAPSQALQVNLPGPMPSGRAQLEVTSDHFIVSILDGSGAVAASVSGDRTPSPDSHLSWTITLAAIILPDPMAYDNLIVTGTA